MIPWNPCPPSRGIRAHLAVEFVPAIAWNSHRRSGASQSVPQAEDQEAQNGGSADAGEKP